LNVWDEAGVPVYSVSSGIALESGFRMGCGNMVQVQTGAHYVTYMHLKPYDLVDVGPVTAGTSLIGRTGGTNTNPNVNTIPIHLHISVSTNMSVYESESEYFIDPLAFIKSWGLTEN
jgi:hypothetical protein